MKKEVLIIVGLIFLIMFLGFLSFSEVVGIRWSSKNLFRSCQPSTINYQSYGPYCVSVAKVAKTFGSTYEVFIGSEGNSYGYYVSYPHDVSYDEGEIAKAKVVWSKEGVQLLIPSGETLFVPKELFTGGR